MQKWAEEAAEAGAVVFLAVHEQCVADGGLQEALTNLGVPHTGTSGQAALTVYDKVWPGLRLAREARCRIACRIWRDCQRCSNCAAVRWQGSTWCVPRVILDRQLAGVSFVYTPHEIA